MISCNIAICYSLLISILVIWSNVLDENGFCILTVAELLCLLLVLIRQNIAIFLQLKVVQVGRAGSGPKFHVNFGTGQVGSLHLWVALGRLKKTGPASNSAVSSSTRYSLAPEADPGKTGAAPFNFNLPLKFLIVLRIFCLVLAAVDEVFVFGRLRLLPYHGNITATVMKVPR